MAKAACARGQAGRQAMQIWAGAGPPTSIQGLLSTCLQAGNSRLSWPSHLGGGRRGGGLQQRSPRRGLGHAKQPLQSNVPVVSALQCTGEGHGEAAGLPRAPLQGCHTRCRERRGTTGGTGTCWCAHLLHHVPDRLPSEGGKHLGQGVDRGRGSHGGGHQTCRQRGGWARGRRRGWGGLELTAGSGCFRGTCKLALLSAVCAGQCCRARRPAAWVGPAGHHLTRSGSARPRLLPAHQPTLSLPPGGGAPGKRTGLPEALNVRGQAWRCPCWARACLGSHTRARTHNAALPEGP
jgi:hypothetical protein